MVHFWSSVFKRSFPPGVRKVGSHEALIGVSCLLRAGIPNEEQVDLLFFSSVLGEYSFRPKAQVQDILVGYEEPLVQENMTPEIANAPVDQPKFLVRDKMEQSGLRPHLLN